MITEDFCSSEIVKLLKEKGFICGATYSKGFVKDGDGFVGGLIRHEDNITHQMAMKWLRCRGIYIEIDVLGKTNIKYGFTILKLNEGEIYSDDKTYTTFEETVETALKYALENLI